MIDRTRAEYCKRLYDQLEKYRKLVAVLSPLTNELGRLWDLSNNIWQKTDLDMLGRYGDFLEAEDSISHLAEMLGRMDTTERELREEQRMEKVFETEWRAKHASKAELVGIPESDDYGEILGLLRESNFGLGEVYRDGISTHPIDGNCDRVSAE